MTSGLSAALTAKEHLECDTPDQVGRVLQRFAGPNAGLHEEIVDNALANIEPAARRLARHSVRADKTRADTHSIENAVDFDDVVALVLEELDDESAIGEGKEFSGLTACPERISARTPASDKQRDVRLIQPC